MLQKDLIFLEEALLCTLDNLGAFNKRVKTPDRQRTISKVEKSLQIVSDLLEKVENGN